MSSDYLRNSIDHFLSDLILKDPLIFVLPPQSSSGENLVKHVRCVNTIRLFTGLLTGLLFAICTLQPSAQSAPDSAAVRPSSLGYDKAHEITINGNVQQVVVKYDAGSPFGVHLLVADAKGTVDAHLGQYLAGETQDSLHSGTPVQIVGAMETIHGKNYLLVRQLIFSGRLITVRSQNGFLLHPLSPNASRSGLAESKFLTELTGGAR
jgi:hypothetical protein